MLGIAAVMFAAHGFRVAWVVPTYRNARFVWRFARRAIASYSGAKVNQSEMAIEFLPTSGWLGIYSANNPVGGRNEAFDLVVVDEAAYVEQSVVTDVFIPTLADRDGRLILSSTPNGMNWFYVEYQNGLADGREIASWHKPSTENPMPTIREAVRRLEERVRAGTYPERAFRQEWLAEFVENAATVFRGVDAAATSETRGYEPGHTYVGGIDWGRTNDFTVFVILDVTDGRVEYVERMSGVGFALQRARLLEIHRRYNVSAWVGEYNAMGGPQVEALQGEGLPIIAFTTTNATKQVVIDHLSLEIESGRLQLLNDPVLLGELRAFRQERLPSGLMRYSAPEGMHDDDVMALALAVWGARRSGVEMGPGLWG